MLLPHGTVFALVDGERFKLYRNTGMEADPELTPMNVPELDPTNRSAGVRHRERASIQVEDRLDEAAHAVAVADWLNGQAMRGKFERLVVIADPRTLGEMRRRYHKELENVIVAEVDRTLTGARPDEIVKILRST